MGKNPSFFSNKTQPTNLNRNLFVFLSHLQAKAYSPKLFWWIHANQIPYIQTLIARTWHGAGVGGFVGQAPLELLHSPTLTHKDLNLFSFLALAFFHKTFLIVDSFIRICKVRMGLENRTIILLTSFTYHLGLNVSVYHILFLCGILGIVLCCGGK